MRLRQSQAPGPPREESAAGPRDSSADARGLTADARGGPGQMPTSWQARFLPEAAPVCDQARDTGARLASPVLDLDRSAPMCRECGVQMVARRNRRDGSAFYGCRRFPECRVTAPITATLLGRSPALDPAQPAFLASAPAQPEEELAPRPAQRRSLTNMSRGTQTGICYARWRSSPRFINLWPQHGDSLLPDPGVCAPVRVPQRTPVGRHIEPERWNALVQSQTKYAGIGASNFKLTTFAETQVRIEAVPRTGAPDR
jgi:ssDNA-binding Zn-finger/Zn-ribbon topoisomerase 1